LREAGGGTQHIIENHYETFLAVKGHDDKSPDWAGDGGGKLIRLIFNNFPILPATKRVLGCTTNKTNFGSSN
jgi:hypothetical protein